jgi:phosphatidate cytidylyltransferase
MLKLRVITALLLAPLVILGVLRLSNPLFSGALLLVVLLCGNEWGRLAGLRGMTERVLYLLSMAGLMAGLWLNASDPVLDLAVLAVAGIWMGMTAAIFAWGHKPLQQVSDQPVVALFGLILLPFAWFSLSRLHLSSEIGPQLTLALLFLIWLADTAAYFGGKRFGRNKLSPVLSPNKTWEGFISAMLAAVLWVVAVKQIIAVPVGFVPLLAIALIVASVSVAGDLFESMVKRRAGEKDSGRLLPGHGGIWDRIDSLVSAAPVFLALMILFGGFDG